MASPKRRGRDFSPDTCGVLSVICGWAQITSQSSVYAASFPHYFVVANTFLPPNIPSLAFVSIPASPEPQAQHFHMSTAISSAHSSLFPYSSSAIYLSQSRVQAISHNTGVCACACTRFLKIRHLASYLTFPTCLKTCFWVSTSTHHKALHFAYDQQRVNCIFKMICLSTYLPTILVL